MEKLQEFVYQEKFNHIEKELDAFKKESLRNSFNLLTISSRTSHLEHFHSDIIAFLLAPSEVHGNKEYLNLFFEYLTKLGVTVNAEDYKNVIVTREKGNIDIWIRDEQSKKSIIIENKINNAGDQQDQLERYFQFAEKLGYTVDSILYLSLNGYKTAPYAFDQSINSLVKNIAAFANSDEDLYNGWIKKCHYKSLDENTSSFIFQYGKLLNHLSNNGMNTELQKEFYNIATEPEGQKRIQTIIDLASRLLEYRANAFSNEIGINHKPFIKKYRYKPNHWLYEKYLRGDNSFKLDVCFHNDGSARIDFWNPGKEESIQEQTTLQELTKIGLEHDFTSGGFGGGHYKIFQDENIKNVDKDVLNYVKNFFEKLQTLK